MTGTKFSDITAVVVNWLSAENTLRAIKSFRKYYPAIKLIVIDDDSRKEDESTFLINYNNSGNNPEKMFDPDTDKLKNLPNSTFLQFPRHEHFGKGEGQCIDLAMQNMKTKWMFHFHSDYRFTKGGILEELLGKVDDKTCAVGESKTKHPQLQALTGVVELVNVELGKEHKLSYKPVIYFDDGRTLPYPESPAGDGMPIAAGGYYSGRLSQLGYKVIHLGELGNKYGYHLRWDPERKKWNGTF